MGGRLLWRGGLRQFEEDAGRQEGGLREELVVGIPCPGPAGEEECEGEDHQEEHARRFETELTDAHRILFRSGIRSNCEPLARDSRGVSHSGEKDVGEHTPC